MVTKTIEKINKVGKILKHVFFIFPSLLNITLSEIFDLEETGEKLQNFKSGHIDIELH